MQQKYNYVVADASCFILLDKVDMLFVLHELFSRIITTPEVALEFGKPLPSWISIKKVKDINFQKAISLK